MEDLATHSTESQPTISPAVAPHLPNGPTHHSPTSPAPASLAFGPHDPEDWDRAGKVTDALAATPYASFAPGVLEGYRHGYAKGYRVGVLDLASAVEHVSPSSAADHASKPASSIPANPAPKVVQADPHKVDYAPAEISSPGTDATLPPAESSPADPNKPFPESITAIVHSDPRTGRDLSPAKPGGVPIQAPETPDHPER